MRNNCGEKKPLEKELLVLKNKKFGYLMNTQPDKAFYGSWANRTCHANLTSRHLKLHLQSF